MCEDRYAWYWRHIDREIRDDKMQAVRAELNREMREEVVSVLKLIERSGENEDCF